jgi:hypothetical protein
LKKYGYLRRPLICKYRMNIWYHAYSYLMNGLDK